MVELGANGDVKDERGRKLGNSIPLRMEEEGVIYHHHPKSPDIPL
jgi:hypothetical protein